MSSAEITEDAIVGAAEAAPKPGGAFARFIKRGGGENERKTVTFGDASAVRSRPFWSLVAFVLLIAFWWVATKQWGFPSGFKAEVVAKYAAESPPATPTHRDLAAECLVAPNCAPTDYTQLLDQTKFPSPSDTWRGFNTLRTDGFKNITLWEHTRISLWRIIRGMVFGSIIGIPIGFAMGLSGRLRGFFDTPVELFRPIPPLAIIPLFIAWFGLGDPSARNLLIFASVWIMIISARAGVRTVKLSKVRAAYSLGASKSQILRRVILPNALPELFTGFRVALGVSWGTVVAAELIGIPTGLGAMIGQARSLGRLDVVVIGTITIAVIGVLMDVLMRFVEAKLIPWRGKG